MKIYMYLSVVLLVSNICAEDSFDLKTYERGLKKYIPWSLTGSAQNLRSDAKNYLQFILRSFILLRPEATWEDQQTPTSNLITEGFAGLKGYLADPDNAAKRDQVEDSLAYIVDTYIPEVRKALEEADHAQPKESEAVLDKKKQLFKEFSEVFDKERADFKADSTEKDIAE